ncbi:MAG: glycosyltransferase family 4 protein [Candidatus Sumerlaeia bacterium]
MASPTILYLIDYVDLGGGETSFISFMARARGTVKPVVIAPARGPVTEALARLDIDVHIVEYPLRFRRGLLPAWRPGPTRRIEEIVRQVGPALVHVFHYFGLVYAGPVARRLGLPVVWTCHGDFELASPIRRWVARRWADHAACVAESARRAAEPVLGPGRVSTNYLGILPFDAGGKPVGREAIRIELGEPTRDPILGVIGRFQPIKGHRHLLDAMPAVRRAVPAARVWIIGDAMFGSGEEAAHKALIEKRVQAEGLGPAVRFLGFRHDARRLMRALDAVVIPSEAESFSMVAVEALEAGVPVVGPDAGGPAEIIEQPATGLRFAPGDSADLAAKIIAVLTREGPGAGFDPSAGPRRARALFSIDAHLERALALYGRLAGLL